MESKQDAVLQTWIADLSAFSLRLGLKCPKFVVKHSRFSPWWLLPAWNATAGAWGGMGMVIVSETHISSQDEIRQYLLAHELGHLANHHSTKAVSGCGLILLGFALTKFVLGLHTSYLSMALAWLAFGCFLVGCFLLAKRLMGYQAEFEADRTAIKLIGREGVIEGILFMSRFEGLTAQRKARLGALGHTEG
jgi:Zn-dependent protease with chaperone function